MTKEEWDDVEKTVMTRFGRVKLLCDGYQLRLGLVKLSAMKLGIGMWINGEINVEWMQADCEERRRFFRPYTRSVWSAPQLAQLKKFSKKQLQNSGLDIGKTFTTYYPWWTSFKPLKAHLIKNNTSIELAPES